MKDFMEGMKDQLNVSKTTNGALGYKSTGKQLLDFHFSISQLRSATEEEIIRKFQYIMNTEEEETFLKYLFYIRDVREGLGERRIFNCILKLLLTVKPDHFKNLIYFIPHYGRWDDLINLIDYHIPEVTEIVIKIIKPILEYDYSIAIKEDSTSSISLLGKWMPSINTSSKLTRYRAKQLCRMLGYSEKEYRKRLSCIRRYLNVVECKMSANQWSEIEYETVPSKANLIYEESFARHDPMRRAEYLANVTSGKAKINSSTLFPHEIIHKILNRDLGSSTVTLEELWKALPNLVDSNSKTIVVGDGSESMRKCIGKTNISSADVCIALCIYFAERLGGIFHNKYITFSGYPEFVDLSGMDSLFHKVEYCLGYCEIANTNIEKVFELILQTAIENNLSQEDIPDNILIISDMEFDECTFSSLGAYPDRRLMDQMKILFKQSGYKLPRIIFWRVNGKTNTIPMKENDLGVTLVSGFSLNIVKMVMSNELDPYKCLLEQINSDRYAFISTYMKRASMISSEFLFNQLIISKNKKSYARSIKIKNEEL